MTWTDEDALTASRRATRLQAIREARGLTTTSMAGRCGLRRNEITDLEAGRRAISLRIVDRIARAFDLPAWRILAKLDGDIDDG